MDVAGALAENLRHLREARGLSQAQIAQIAGIPRPTWASLESGSANPTLAVLTRVAAALQVRLDELLAPPRASAQLYHAAQLPIRNKGLAQIRRLLPDPLPGLEAERMALPPRASFAGVPHTPGTREYLTVESGAIELTVSGEKFLAQTGDVVVFAGDQKHGYRNAGETLAIAYSVVAFAPTGS